MSRPLNVLIVEDVERDAVLLLRELRRGGYEPAFERVETAEGMTAALEKQPWDLIISDYVMPHFSGINALKLMKEKGLELPFIIVSGTITEEIAAEAMHAGAHDFMVKGKLARLLPAIERELHEAAGRAERKKMQAELLIAVRVASAVEARERTVGNREELARLGEAAADTREAAADTREAAADSRNMAADTREAAADTRERTVEDREELARLREEALCAREEADEANAERDRLLVQTRAANEKLVLATLQAQTLADEAEVARDKIAESEERFRSLVTTSAAIVWRADALGRHLDSPSWTVFTGLSLGDEGQALQSIHPDDRERVHEAWRQATTNRSLYVAEFRLLRRDGSYAWVVSRAVPIPEAPAPLREWVGMTTDITDSKRVEEARERFIGILGHDLRNPLSAITMGVESLGALPEPHSKVVGRIGRSAQRMEAMIRDVLDFARGRLGDGIPVVPSQVDLHRLCKEMVAEMTQAYPARTFSFEAAGDLRGKWDPDRVEQVLSNLLGNAVTHGEGAIRVTASETGDDVITTVHNEGAAIPAAVIPTLFDPFSKAAQAVSGKHGAADGLGLGLYIASEIVHAHGGTISVSSVQGEGTTFAIRWPRKAPR